MRARLNHRRLEACLPETEVGLYFPNPTSKEHEALEDSANSLWLFCEIRKGDHVILFDEKGHHTVVQIGKELRPSNVSAILKETELEWEDVESYL